MLSCKSYPTDHVDRARHSFGRDLTRWREAAAEAPDALADLEVAYFGNLLVALDAWFVHRMRGQEGKDGNPLNEVRLVVESIVDHDGTFTTDPKIKLDAAASILGLDDGDRIAVTADDFARVLPAFLDEITKRFPDDR